MSWKDRANHVRSRNHTDMPPTSTKSLRIGPDAGRSEHVKRLREHGGCGEDWLTDFLQGLAHGCAVRPGDRRARPMVLYRPGSFPQLLTKRHCDSAPRLRRGRVRISTRAEIELLIKVIGALPRCVSDLLLQGSEPLLQRFGNRQPRGFADLAQCGLSFVVESHGSYRHSCITDCITSWVTCQEARLGQHSS